MTRSFCTGPDGGLLLLIGALLLSGVAASSPAAAQSACPAVPDADARWRTLRSEILDPDFFFQSVGAGTGAHLGDEPEAWGETPGGYAARAGSNAGAALLQIGTTHALAAALRLDIRPRLRQHDGVGNSTAARGAFSLRRPDPPSAPACQICQTPPVPTPAPLPKHAGSAGGGPPAAPSRAQPSPWASTSA